MKTEDEKKYVETMLLNDKQKHIETMVNSP